MLCCRHAQTEITQAIRHEVTTMRPWRGLTLPLLLMVLAGFFEEARAEPVTLHGLTFSDELGGFTILNGWGSGSLADPITIVEEVTTTTGAVLVIRGLGPESGNPIPTAHPAGFVLRKIVINATNLSWNIYDVELQKVLGTPSDIFDGLSFGQSSQAGRPFPSDRFGQSALLEEPSDNLSFFDGLVAPGQTVTITFVVTVTGPVPEFFILQRPNRPLAALAGSGSEG
jgi:hypothetical protein